MQDHVRHGILAAGGGLAGLRCVRVCPKGVPPARGILATRERLSSERE